MTVALLVVGVLGYFVGGGGFDVKDEEGEGEAEWGTCGSECDILDETSHVAVVGDRWRGAA